MVQAAHAPQKGVRQCPVDADRVCLREHRQRIVTKGNDHRATIRRARRLEPINGGHSLGDHFDVALGRERQKIGRGSQPVPGRSIDAHQNRHRTLAPGILNHPAVTREPPDRHAARRIRPNPGIETVMVTRNGQHGGINH